MHYGKKSDEIPKKELCHITEEFGKKILVYKCERELASIKPYLSECSDGLFVEMHMHRVQLKVVKNLSEMKDSKGYFLRMSLDSLELKDIDSLFNEINNYCKSNNEDFNLMIIEPEIASVSMSLYYKWSYLIERSKKCFMIVRFSKPPEMFVDKFSTPIGVFHNSKRSCLNCLSLFKVRENGKVTFCDGSIANRFINEYNTRKEIYQEFVDSKKEGYCIFMSTYM